MSASASKSTSQRNAARRRAAALAAQSADADFPPLTKAQVAELDRRVAEMNDPTRYLVVSAFSKRFVLYYNVEDNCYAHNRPEGGTAFKSLDVARAVLAALSVGRRKGKDRTLQIVKARKTKTDLRLLEKPTEWLDTLGVKRRAGGTRKSKIENRKS